MPEILMPQPYVSPWMQDEVADVLTLARTFFAREVTPHAERFAEQHQVDKETWLAAGALGTQPGGAGAGVRDSGMDRLRALPGRAAGRRRAAPGAALGAAQPDCRGRGPGGRRVTGGRGQRLPDPARGLSPHAQSAISAGTQRRAPKLRATLGGNGLARGPIKTTTVNHVSVNKVLLSALPALALLLPTMAAADRITVRMGGRKPGR